ncbi:hypothetical protein M3J09_003294 [Ascochyta lentis]
MLLSSATSSPASVTEDVRKGFVDSHSTAREPYTSTELVASLSDRSEFEEPGKSSISPFQPTPGTEATEQRLRSLEPAARPPHDPSSRLVVCQTTTRSLTERLPSPDALIRGVMPRTSVSRHPTRVPAAPFESSVQKDIRRNQGVDETNEAAVETESAHCAVIDEQLAVYDIYHASPEVVVDVVRQETPAVMSRTTNRKHSSERVQAESTATCSPFSALSPSPRVSITGTSTLGSKSTREATPEVSLVAEMIERHSKRQSTKLHTLGPAQGLGCIDRAPTIDPFWDVEGLTPPSVCRDAKAALHASSKLERRKICAFLDTNEHVPRVSTTPSISIARERKVSTAAPGIMAPPPQMIDILRKPTNTEKKPRKKMPNYPPERQYPPAPRYPVRETPAWTKPDTHTPPPRPKAEPTPKKRCFFALRPKPKNKPKTIQRWASGPRYYGPKPQTRQSPEPHHDRPFELFRNATTGRLPTVLGGTLQTRRSHYTAPAYRPISRVPASLSLR